MIEIKHLSKTFQMKDGAVNALKDINLTIPDGSIFGIIGMSGAGKSTLVRCINLLERPTEGSVVIDGVEMEKLTPAQLRQRRREITMIFQPVSYTHLDVYKRQGVCRDDKKALDVRMYDQFELLKDHAAVSMPAFEQMCIRDSRSPDLHALHGCTAVLHPGCGHRFPAPAKDRCRRRCRGARLVRH